MLTLDDRKLLPPGVHDASLKEVGELFGQFQRSDRRPKLFRKLREYVTALRKADCAETVIINGSFVMACVDEPEDIDLIVVLPPMWDWTAELKPFQYNLLSKRRVRRGYGFDAFPVGAGSEDEWEWFSFFSQISSAKWRWQFGWPAEAKKGLVRVKI